METVTQDTKEAEVTPLVAVTPPPPMDNPLIAGPDAYGSGREFKITAAMLAALPATGGLIILGGLPLGTITQLVRWWVTTPVAGAPTPTCSFQLQTVDVGQSPPVLVTTLGAAFDGTQAAGTQVATQLTSGNVEPVNTRTALAVLVTGTNLNGVTAGLISAFARYVALAPAPPLRYDTTAQTPRVMPPY